MPLDRKNNPLPDNLPPRLLSRCQSAAYNGISPTKFDQLVGDGRMPQPLRIDGRRVWDIRALDRAIDVMTQQSHSDVAHEDTWEKCHV